MMETSVLKSGFRDPGILRDRLDVPENSRARLNLRQLLAELGNRLVQEHGFEPANLYGCSAFMNHTLEPLVRFLVWLEHTPEAGFVLQDMGVWRLDQGNNDLGQFNKEDQGRTTHESDSRKLDGPRRPRH